MTYLPRMHIVLYQPEIPQNTGAIGRTCVALQAKLWLVRPLGFRIDEKALRRAGLDYWQHLNWEVVDDWDSLVEQLAEPFQNQRCWYFTKRATKAYTEPEFAEADVLVFGCETKGLPSDLREQRPEQNLRIPISAKVRSLNLSCSVAVAGYEVIRQLGCSLD